jgi:hypothetical protein
VDDPFNARSLQFPQVEKRSREQAVGLDRLEVAARPPAKVAPFAGVTGPLSEKAPKATFFNELG